MRAQQWRPSTALRKRRGHYLSLIDVTGIGSIFSFLLFMFIVGVGGPHDHTRISVDLPTTRYASPQPGALKEDAVEIAMTRAGSVYLQNHKVALAALAEQVRECVREGSDRQIYVYADSRAKFADVAQTIAHAPTVRH
jgi:biopolymer transport protein ExbD